MTTRRKCACLAAAGIAAALVIAFFLTRRTDRREPEVASPSDSQLQATETRHTPGTVPTEAEAGDGRSGSELIQVTTGSISGRLMDTEGKIITGLETTLRFSLVGQGTQKEFDVQRNGTYCVEDLPEGVYWIRLFNTYEFSHRGQRHCLEKLPDRVRVGTRDADIVVVSPNPGRIRGKVLYAGTMQPVTQFTVCQKYDLNSAPERSRRSALYSEFAATSGYPGHGYTPLVESYKRQCDRLQGQMGALEPETHQDQIEQLAAEYNSLREELEKYRLDVVSRDGVFERSAYLLGEYVFTVLADGCLPKSVEVGLYDSKPVEITFVMDQDGSRIVGKVQDDSGHPVLDANVDILVPTNTEYLYFWTADPEWERVGFVTGESGEFAFDNIADGRYEVRASHPDYVTVAASSVKVLDHLQEPSSIALTMRKGDAGVWGQIGGSDGSPQTYAGIKISSGSCSLTCTTDKDGHYSVKGLAPGNYVMTFSTEGLEDRECRFSLLPSQHLRYDVLLAGSSKLWGAIHLEEEYLLLGSELRMVLRSEGMTIRSPSQRGHNWYEFTSLPAGRYELEVFSDLLGNVKYAVTLASNEEKRLHLYLGQYGALKGSVIGRDGRPLGGVPLTIISAGKTESATSDREGRYMIQNLLPGHVQVMIAGGEFAGTWNEFELKRLPLGSVPTDTNWDIDLSPLGDVSGQVFQEGGKPLGRAVLTIQSPQRSVEAVTDREGRFRAEGLFPGQCRIHLPQPMSGRAYAFDLAPKEKKELQIILPP